MGKKYKLPIILICIALVLILMDRASNLDGVAFPIRRILSPFQQLTNWCKELVYSPISYVQFIYSGEKRLKELETKNLELISQTQKIKDLESENSDLKQQLGSDFSKSRILLPAKVLGIGRLLEVEIPKNSEKIKTGQAVVYLDNYLGRVKKIGWGIAFVELVSDPDSKVGAKTLNASGVVTGEFSSGIVFDRVAKSETLNVGDVVQTSGMEGLIPANLIFGKIEKIEPTNNELFLRASVSQLYSLEKIRTVYIVID